MFLYKLTAAYEAENDVKLDWAATTTLPASCFLYMYMSVSMQNKNKK